MSGHSSSTHQAAERCDTRCRVLWWLVGAVIFLAPLPLGANRPWAWSLLSALELTLVAVALVVSRQSAWRSATGQRSLVALMLAFAALPVLQLIPMPAELLQVTGAGSLHAWSLAGRSGAVPASIDIGLTMDVGIRQAASVLLALLMLRLFRYREVCWQFVHLVIAMGVLNALLGLSMFLAGDAMTGTYANKNHFAGLIGMALPLAVAAMVRRRRQCHSRHRSPGSDIRYVIFSGAALLLGTALLLSASRGAVAASVLALLLTLVVFVNSRAVRRRLLLAALSIGVLGAVALALLVGEEALWDMYVNSLGGRTLQWLDTLRVAPQYWLLGSGVGTYDFAYPAFKSPQLGFVRYDHAHSDYLEFLTTMGVVGLALFLSIVGVSLSGIARRDFLRRGLQNNALAFGAAWSAVAALIHAGADFNLQIPANFLLFLGVLMLLASSTRGLAGHGAKPGAVGGSATAGDVDGGPGQTDRTS